MRETHQAMEAVAAHRGMVSMSLCNMTADLPPQIAAECTNFVMSAFGRCQRALALFTWSSVVAPSLSFDSSWMGQLT